MLFFQSLLLKVVYWRDREIRRSRNIVFGFHRRQFGQTKVNHRLKEEEEPFNWPILPSMGVLLWGHERIQSSQFHCHCFICGCDQTWKLLCGFHSKHENHSQWELSPNKQWNYLSKLIPKLEQHRFERKTGHGKISPLYNSLNTINK